MFGRYGVCQFATTLRFVFLRVGVLSFSSPSSDVLSLDLSLPGVRGVSLSSLEDVSLSESVLEDRAFSAYFGVLCDIFGHITRFLVFDFVFVLAFDTAFVFCLKFRQEAFTPLTPTKSLDRRMYSEGQDLNGVAVLIKKWLG